MKKIVGHIILISVIFLTYNWANQISDSNFREETICYISEKVDSLPLITNKCIPYLPEAELGSIGTNPYQSATSRILRTNFHTYLNKISLGTRNISARQTILIRQREKSCSPSTLLSHPVSEYYVFALRHIII